MSNEMIPNKNKHYAFGYLVGRAVARTDYSGGEVFLNSDDAEMMDGYNDGFAAECRVLGKNPEALVEKLDADRLNDMVRGALILDILVAEDEEEYYGTMKFLNQENARNDGGAITVDVKPWDRVQFILLYDDDEVSFEPEVGEMEILELRFIDDVLRVQLRLERPIKSYLRPRRLQ